MSFTPTLLKAAAIAFFAASSVPALAGDMTDHNMATHAGHAMMQSADSQAYRFVLVGAPKALGTKQHVVTVRLLEAMQGMPDMPVSGATITTIRLDMGPANMASMTAPVREIPNGTPGLYSFSFDDAAVWKWKGDWALSLTAKIPGASQPVSGHIVFHAGT